MRLGRTVRRMISGLAVVVLLYSLGQLYGIWVADKQDQQAFVQLAVQVQAAEEQADQMSAATESTHAMQQPTEAPANPSEQSILPQYAPVYRQNPDFCGWIRIEDTALDYPVMATPQEPEYYLRRSYTGADSRLGTPFLGAGCSLEPRSDNVLIYGHNIQNGTMFAPLLSYQEESFWREHPTISFDTLYETGEYAVAAVFLVDVSKNNEHFAFYDFINAGDNKAYETYINQCKALSLYETNVTPSPGDPLITLVTCSYHSANGRLVVVAAKQAM